MFPLQSSSEIIKQVLFDALHFLLNSFPQPRSLLLYFHPLVAVATWNFYVCFSQSPNIHKRSKITYLNNQSLPSFVAIKILGISQNNLAQLKKTEGEKIDKYILLKWTFSLSQVSLFPFSTSPFFHSIVKDKDLWMQTLKVKS